MRVVMEICGAHQYDRGRSTAARARLARSTVCNSQDRYRLLPGNQARVSQDCSISQTPDPPPSAERRHWQANPPQSLLLARRPSTSSFFDTAPGPRPLEPERELENLARLPDCQTSRTSRTSNKLDLPRPRQGWCARAPEPSAIGTKLTVQTVAARVASPAFTSTATGRQASRPASHPLRGQHLTLCRPVNPVLRDWRCIGVRHWLWLKFARLKISSRLRTRESLRNGGLVSHDWALHHPEDCVDCVALSTRCSLGCPEALQICPDSSQMPPEREGRPSEFVRPWGLDIPGSKAKKEPKKKAKLKRQQCLLTTAVGGTKKSSVLTSWVFEHCRCRDQKLIGLAFPPSESVKRSHLISTDRIGPSFSSQNQGWMPV